MQAYMSKILDNLRDVYLLTIPLRASFQYVGEKTLQESEKILRYVFPSVAHA